MTRSRSPAGAATGASRSRSLSISVKSRWASFRPLSLIASPHGLAEFVDPVTIAAGRGVGGHAADRADLLEGQAIEDLEEDRFLLSPRKPFDPGEEQGQVGF